VGLELADIVRKHGPSYIAKQGNRLLPSQRKALRAIVQCRTEALGGHVYTCEKCGQVQYRYHSCRNRHCPKCQQEETQEWLAKNSEFLPEAPYYLTTFTLPAGLRKLAGRNQKAVYGTLFRASARAMQRLAWDQRFLGGLIGILSILHTWTRDMRSHPHVHCLVPAVGIDEEGQVVYPKRKGFLFPVRALSRLFRGEFRRMLSREKLEGEIPQGIWKEEWVVHCKPVGSGKGALKYLAPYVFRVALSNRRLVKMEGDQITFRYKDSRTRETKYCTLPAEAFLYRFLQHILPRGFVKVRYYGLFAPGMRKVLASLCEQLGARKESNGGDTKEERKARKGEEEVVYCPVCGIAMRKKAVAPKHGRDPP
jgi:uncharacterized Zn finger protein (UPF0148 family)